MKCPECQFENPDGIKFCGECGNKLEKLCPSCHSPNPPQFKFCGECGGLLSVKKTAEKQVSYLDSERKMVLLGMQLILRQDWKGLPTLVRSWSGMKLIDKLKAISFLSVWSL
jgi:predicted amidophosphoribosyltransferase